MEHLDDRPPNSTAVRPAARGMEDVNWFPLVRSAFLAALTAFMVKLISLGYFANQLEISLEVQFWKGFIPHLSMQTPPDEFAQIVTSSTFVMSIVMVAVFVGMVLRTNTNKMMVWGWFMGVFVSFETLGLEMLRHTLEPPVVDTATVWRTLVPLTAGAAIAVAYALISREKVERPARVKATSRAVLATPDGGRAVDARPAAFQGAPVVADAVDPANPFGTPAAAPPPPPLPAPMPKPAVPAAPVPVGASAGLQVAPVSVGMSAVLAAAAVPNRVVDTRPAAPQGGADPLDLPAPRLSSRPPSDTGPAPIVDTRPAAQRESQALEN